MIILITGASHVGKTYFAQKLLEKYKYPYLSIDHLKMGLIRSGNTTLTPLSDDNELTNYLWPIVREIIKTAIENKQNLKNHFDDIKKYENVIENRLCDDCIIENVLNDNKSVLELAKKYNVNCILIDDKYEIDI